MIGQVATVHLPGLDTLAPLWVYLWRDEKSVFLRRQAEVLKFGRYFS